jgi:hypothetical protein
MTKALSVATLNVGSITHKSDDLDKELKGRKIDIAVISKTKKKNEGSKELENYIMISSGVPSEEWASSGIAILVRKDWKNRIIGYEYILPRIVRLRLSVPWLTSLVAGLSLRRTGFVPRSIHVGFMVDKVAWDRYFSEFFGFPVNISFHHRSPKSYHLRSAQYASINAGIHPSIITVTGIHASVEGWTSEKEELYDDLQGVYGRSSNMSILYWPEILMQELAHSQSLCSLTQRENRPSIIMEEA